MPLLMITLNYIFNVYNLVIGCPTFETPKDTIMEEVGGLVTVKCSHNDKMWKMRCIGNHWIGIKGNCTKVKTEVEVDVHFKKENYVFGMPPGKI